ncbi:MAG TPA: acyl-CoA dehydrogenase family protein, partial [Myxococcota bacterium]|nr:acyl-CoA dehydrogenase family protein [Myxococcota bacterium]
MSPELLAALDARIIPVATQHAIHTDRAAAFPEATLQALREADLLGLLTPIAHGGQGRTVAEAATVVERLARVCGSSAMVVCMHYCGAAGIAAHGSPELNRAVAEGRVLATLAFSEVGSRSHFWAPVSTATRVANGIRLDAQKSWVTSAGQAQAIVWSSKPVAAEGASTLWWVPGDSPGLSRPTAFDGLGLRGNDSAPLRAEGVVIPEAHR